MSRIRRSKDPNEQDFIKLHIEQEKFIAEEVIRIKQEQEEREKKRELEKEQEQKMLQERKNAIDRYNKEKEPFIKLADTTTDKFVVDEAGRILKGKDKEENKLNPQVVLPIVPLDLEDAKLVEYEYNGNKATSIIKLWEMYTKRFDENTDWKFQNLENSTDNKDMTYKDFKDKVKCRYLYNVLGREKEFCCDRKLKSFYAILIEQERYDYASQWEYYRLMLCRTHKPETLYRAGIITFGEAQKAREIYNTYNKK